MAPRGHHNMGAPVDKPKDAKGTAKRFLKILGQFKLKLLVVVIFAVASTAFSIVSPIVLAQATNAIYDGLVAKVAGVGGIDFDLVAQVILIVLVLYLLSAGCTYVQSWIMAGVTQKISFDLRRKLVEKIDRMPFGYFEKNQIGDTLSRITNDVDTLGSNLSMSVTQVITALVTVVGIIGIMLSMNPVMTLIVILCAPLSVVVMIIIVKVSQKHYIVQQRYLGNINSLVEETFSGHDVVCAYNHEQDCIKRFKEENDVLYNAAWKSQYASSFIKPGMDVVTNAGYVGVALVGCIFAVQGMLTVGEVQAFIQYEKNFMNPIQQLSHVASMLQQMAAAAERVFEFLDSEEIEDQESTQSLDDGDLSIEFDHVGFGYDPDKPVIKDFSCAVKNGQTVALVGPTGAGKTTIVKLLMRFYDVQSGAIRIGGKDIREFTREDIRAHFGMVLQDTWLFHGTIRDNLRYGKIDATDEEIEAAARIGFSHHFITTLPDGYDFVINEDGTNISQGERQLLTITRAILANRSMLILDEATSSVDTRTEKNIQEAMDRMMEGRTSFVIAHRLSTIKNADIILVMRDGDIVEIGTHDSLLALDGFYAELYNSQFEDCD